MQPQDSGDLGGWWHALSGTGGGALGAVLAWVWRAARVEPKLQLEIKSAEERVEKKIEAMTDHFREYFEGIRRQQDDIKLNVEEKFVRKDDFKDFREELRETLRDIKESVQSIAKESRK